jgi:hypothetical protein
MQFLLGRPIRSKGCALSRKSTQRAETRVHLARPQTSSVVRRGIGPTFFWPKFQFSKKQIKKTGDVHCSFVCSTRRTTNTKKRRQTTLACYPFRVAVALPCFFGVVYFCSDTFFIGFTVATACYHCVHIVFLLHDFDCFSYSLSTTSC